MLDDIFDAFARVPLQPLTVVLISKLMMELVSVNGMASCLRESHAKRLKVCAVW
jgi:hypothetical protein